MKRYFMLASILIAWILLSFGISSATEKGEVILSGGPVFTPIIGGQISDTEGAPDYSDIFNSGLGLGMDGMFYLASWLRLGAGFSVSVFEGDTYGGLDVSKWWVAPMMVGAQFFPLGSKKKLPKPYVRLDLGMTFYSAVKIDNPTGGLEISLFETSTAFAGDVGVGVEYRFSGQWGVFGEARYMMGGHPIGAGDLPIHSPDPVSFLPVRAGLVYEY